jgi:hypothetical protein
MDRQSPERSGCRLPRADGLQTFTFHHARQRAFVSIGRTRVAFLSGPCYTRVYEGDSQRELANRQPRRQGLSGVPLKYLVLSFVLLLVFAVLYQRARPYLLLARRIFGAVSELRRAGYDRGAERPPLAAGHTLVRCAGCGTWIPSTRALPVGGSKIIYCSRVCQEIAAAKLA